MTLPVTNHESVVYDFRGRNSIWVESASLAVVIRMYTFAASEEVAVYLVTARKHHFGGGELIGL